MPTQYTNKLKVDLGFPQGLCNPEALARQRAYQRRYRQIHKIRDRIKERKHDKKRNAFFPGLGTRMSRYLFAALNKTKKLSLRKARMKDARKKMLELQKLYPNHNNRQYHLYTGYSSRVHNPKLSRCNDMSEVPKRSKTPQRRKAKPKHT